MAQSHQYDPLDHTIGALERLAGQMRRALEMNEPPTVEDFHAVMIFVEWLVTELKPLQDLTVQKQR